MDKHRVAAVLEEVGTLLELTGANSFRVRAFANAARSLDALDADLETLVREDRLAEIPGIGKGIARDVAELVTTGALAVHAELRAQVPAGLLQILRVPGLGPKKVRALWERLGIADLAALEVAARQGKLRELEGFGAKSEEKILAGIERVRQYEGRVLWPIAWRVAREFAEALEKDPRVRRVEIAGSLRRRLETAHDADLLAAVEEPDREAVMEGFATHPLVREVIARGPTKSSVVSASGLQVDLRAVSDAEFAFALHHFTGSKEHNTKLRTRAKSLGLHMSEWGVFRGEEPLPAKDEAGVFAILGLSFIEPELREDLGEIEAAESGTLPRLLERGDVRGILHSHTTASDGRASLREMADGARERGFAYLGISDHSPAAFYASGLDAARLAAQHAEIEALRSERTDITIFHGVESDILDDGSLDYDDEVLATLDFVVASVHSRFGLSSEAMTDRVLTAIRHPAVSILGHPTGRLLLEREPFALDVDAVLREAARLGVAVELNANPHRLDLDWRMLRRATSLGVTISIGPDAHDVAGLDDTWIGVGIARKGWLGPENVLNCRSASDVLAFCAKRRQSWTPAAGTRSRFDAGGKRLA